MSNLSVFLFPLHRFSWCSPSSNSWSSKKVQKCLCPLWGWRSRGKTWESWSAHYSSLQQNHCMSSLHLIVQWFLSAMNCTGMKGSVAAFYFCSVTKQLWHCRPMPWSILGEKKPHWVYFCCQLNMGLNLLSSPECLQITLHACRIVL